MKNKLKIITLLIIATATILVSLCGCQKEPSYEFQISQLRKDVLFGENENFSVTLNSESREVPFIHDGEVGTLEQVVIIKISSHKPINEQINVTFSTDKEYSEKLTFEPHFNSYVASIKVDSLPEKNLTVTIKNDNSAENIELLSKKNANISSYSEAISCISKKRSELFSELTTEYGFATEINVRLIIDGESNFWFVGIIDKNQTHAFLLDATTLEILAEKKLDTKK